MKNYKKYHNVMPCACQRNFSEIKHEGKIINDNNIICHIFNE